ncbi:MAG: NAD-dependent epimerase/dehydratase family protein [Cyclobacteriaceae bacterium]|nr:NAD-dependent epimerase/dehydratase family protein [Cyclobacteriaceae bacterium]
MDRILITGALGQLGTELVPALQEVYGTDQVIATDIHNGGQLSENTRFVVLDAMDAKTITQIVDREKITQIYHLAAILSARGEQNPHHAWELNMTSLLNILELCRNRSGIKLFWPSSIGVFGEDTPRFNTPQYTVMNPTTVYGISKLAGEKWCTYYYKKHKVDVRSIRYPGLIGYRSLPGGGTTDYAVDIYYKALEEERFNCFLAPETKLPMMYMPDAIRATLELMQAEESKIRVRSSYNVSGMSFSPAEVAASIQKHIPDFSISYQPDYRQGIANSWPDSIDESYARDDWGWRQAYDLDSMTADMLENLRPRLARAI